MKSTKTAEKKATEKKKFRKSQKKTPDVYDEETCVQYNTQNNQARQATPSTFVLFFNKRKITRKRRAAAAAKNYS